MKELMFPKEAEKLGPYELVTELASGGMATVYLARRAGLGGFSRSVAIKRLRSEIAQAPPFLAMLIDEANLAARIHHPNVAATLEFGSDGDEHYLVMEYVEGGSFLDLIARSLDRGEIVPPRVVLRVILDALAGLHAAHELTGDDGAPLELVHRDLSPHNLMVGLDGCTRIVDFGLARATSRLTKTAVGVLKGKLAYMAPEQLHQRPLDRRADLFAAGIVLWEGLRGQRLFKADTDVATIERVLRGDIPSLRQSLPWLPTGVNAVVMKSLARDPGARFATAEEMGAALSDAAEAAELVGSRREVSACVASLMGDELAARRERLRAWVEKHESPLKMPATSSGRGPARPSSDDALAAGAPNTQLAFSVPEAAVPSDLEAMRVIVDESEPAPIPLSRRSRKPSNSDILTSLTPAHPNEPTTVLARRQRRSWSPLIGGAAIGLCAIAIALLARGGLGGAVLGGTGLGGTGLSGSVQAPADGVSLGAQGTPGAALPGVTSAVPPAASTAPPVTEIIAAPEVDPTSAPSSGSEIIAQPEPASSSRKARTRRPSGGSRGPGRDLDNPYK